MDSIREFSLSLKEGASDKVYAAQIVENAEGCKVVIQYGRRGSTLVNAEKTVGYVSLEKASNLLAGLYKEKTKKGYLDSGSPLSTLTASSKEKSGHLPQLLNAVSEDQMESLIANDNWVFQEKIDGERRMISIAAGNITGINRKGEVVALPQSIMDDITNTEFFKQSKNGETLIDGEIVGESYHLFDIIKKDGLALSGVDFLTRYKLLALMHSGLNNASPNNVSIIAVATATSRDEKINLIQDLKNGNKEGLVMKEAGGHYNIGRPNSGGVALKFKFYDTCTCVVDGVNTQRSVSISLLDEDGKLENVGNVTVPPNQVIPKVGDLIEVRYLYANLGGSLYQPTLLGLRSDIESPDLLSNIKLKPENDCTNKPSNKPRF